MNRKKDGEMVEPDLVVTEASFSTADPDVAHEVLVDAYGETTMRLNRPIVDDGLLSFQRTDAPRVTLTAASSSAELEVLCAGGHEVVFSTIQDGVIKIDRGEDVREVGETVHGPGDMLLSIQPGVEWVHKAGPTRNTAIAVDEALLRGVAGADPDATDLHWEPLSSAPIPSKRGLWRETTRFVEEALVEPAAARAPLFVAEVERVLAATVLSVFPNGLIGPTSARAREGLAGSETLRRAVAFIESNPQVAISSADIAAAAHCTQRAVEHAFRRHLDTSPMAYLRKVRLQHVHEELTGLSPRPGLTVSSIALKWGFRNHGRFAEVYRSEFGEYPSETLKRG